MSSKEGETCIYTCASFVFSVVCVGIWRSRREPQLFWISYIFNAKYHANDGCKKFFLAGLNDRTASVLCVHH